MPDPVPDLTVGRPLEGAFCASPFFFFFSSHGMLSDKTQITSLGSCLLGPCPASRPQRFGKRLDHARCKGAKWCLEPSQRLPRS